MSIITDGLLIATCLTAALYCIVLSRRLSRFSDTESGIGKQISQLNVILEETRTSAKESQAGAKTVSERLARDLSGAKKATQDLAALIERAEVAMDREFELRGNPTPPRQQKDEIEETVAPTPSDVTPHREESVSVSEPNLAQRDETLPEDEPQDELVERDFDLADARGEPQLGFLPNITDTSSSTDIALDDSEDAKSPASSTEKDADEENLLKVERMAL